MISEALIIGAGVVGFSIARELYKKGLRRITLVDRGVAGKEASFAAAGILAPNAETNRADDFNRLCAESLKLYTDFAIELFSETGIDIQLDRSGTLYLAFTDKDSKELRERFNWQRKAGLAVELLSADETLRSEPSVSGRVRESLFFPNDWQVENRRLLCALRKYAGINGIKIIEHVEIEHLIVEQGKIKGAASRDKRFLADSTILATGAWTSLIKIGDGVIPLKVKPIRGQLICFQAPEKIFNKVIYSVRGYIVPRADGRILAGATVEDVGFNKSTTDAGTELLWRAAVEIAPYLAKLKIVDSWAGLRPFGPDGLPVIGRMPGAENLFVATAHYRNGILLAPITAKIAAENIVEGKTSEYMRAFSPEPPCLSDAVLASGKFIDYG